MVGEAVGTDLVMVMEGTDLVMVMEGMVMVQDSIDRIYHRFFGKCCQNTTLHVQMYIRTCKQTKILYMLECRIEKYIYSSLASTAVFATLVFNRSLILYERAVITSTLGGSS